MKLEGKSAIITGAGKGIGREAALAVAAEGAAVAAVARTQADLNETVKMIEDRGGSAAAFSHDLTIGTEVQAMVDEVIEKYGTMQADIRLRSTKISNIRQSSSGSGRKNSGIRLLRPMSVSHFYA